METWGVTFCTDAIVEEHREALEALLGPFSCTTSFQEAVTWLRTTRPTTAEARASALLLLTRHGRMELIAP